jgi:predicted transcriptional regulator
MESPVMKENVSIRLEADTLGKLEQIAALMDRDRSAIITEAVDAYLGFHQRQLAEIEQAIREADAGDFATPEEMDATTNKYRP